MTTSGPDATSSSTRPNDLAASASLGPHPDLDQRSVYAETTTNDDAYSIAASSQMPLIEGSRGKGNQKPGLFKGLMQRMKARNDGNTAQPGKSGTPIIIEDAWDKDKIGQAWNPNNDPTLRKKPGKATFPRPPPQHVYQNTAKFKTTLTSPDPPFMGGTIV